MDTERKIMNINQEVDDYAINSFRRMADGDYVSARLSFRAQLMPQFFWQGLQAVEKYIKCILLLHRVSSKDLGHDLCKGVKRLFEIKCLDFRLSEWACSFLRILDKYGKDRYLEKGYNSYPEQLPLFDQLVAELRIYCRVDYEKFKDIQDVRCIYIEDGFLESILSSDHPAQEALTWQNAFFGKKRDQVELPLSFIAERSVVVSSPEIITELRKYIHLSKPTCQKYENLAKLIK